MTAGILLVMIIVVAAAFVAGFVYGAHLSFSYRKKIGTPNFGDRASDLVEVDRLKGENSPKEWAQDYIIKPKFGSEPFDTVLKC